MRYKTSCSLNVQLVDRNSAIVSFVRIIRKLDGLACFSDTTLNYAELSFSKEYALRGGHPRLVLDDKGRLTMAVEIDSLRRLSRTELKALREDIEGQLSDGIGAGCFDELTTSTGLAVELKFPLKSKCTQTEGTAWRPKASTNRGNEQRIAAIAKMVEKLDSSPQKLLTPKKSATDETVAAPSSDKLKPPNLTRLFRLLGKPERDQLFDKIKAELEACGNDLSMVVDGEYPAGNFVDPKLLRLLLKAGLPPESTDAKGSSLLIQAAGNPQCLKLLLKEGVNVNRVCDNRFATTALIRAAWLGKRKSVELLLEHGADPAIEDMSGKLAEDLVAKHSRERQKIVELLQARS